MTIQSEVASRFSDVGTSLEDDRERDAVADCTVVGGMHRAAEAGILSEVDVSGVIPIWAVFLFGTFCPLSLVGTCGAKMTV